MVHYRLIDFDKDRDEVILLINENLTPRNNKEFFQWKHLDNPNGSSTGAVATVNEKIVAVVFYLPYNFINNGNVVKAARPVEGCTAKNFRGRRIFKNLMKFCLESYNKDYKFLFANPNKFSHPEFLKMGWNEVSGYEYRLGIIIPWKKQDDLIFCPTSKEKYSNNIRVLHDDYTSAGSTEFINWRYANKRYTVKEFLIGERKNFLIYRISKIKNIKCIILCDFCGDENYINAAVKKACRMEGTWFVYFLNNKTTSKINFVITKRHRKAVITYTEKEPNIIQKIRFSLGDLEGTV